MREACDGFAEGVEGGRRHSAGSEGERRQGGGEGSGIEQVWEADVREVEGAREPDGNFGYAVVGLGDAVQQEAGAGRAQRIVGHVEGAEWCVATGLKRSQVRQDAVSGGMAQRRHFESASG